MQPAKENNSEKNGTYADINDQDPYLVSLASMTRKSAPDHSEAIRGVVNEMQGTALRRRTELLRKDS